MAKVRVAYTVDVTDEYRRAIRRYYGRPGMATRDDVVQWHRNYGDSMDADLMAYYNDDLAGDDR